MYKRILPGLILVFAAFYLQADENRLPAKELVQYVRDAKKAGLEDGQIQKNAVQAGWPEAAVTDAITAARTTTKTEEVVPPAATAEVKSPAPAQPAQAQPTAEPAAATTAAPEPVKPPVKAVEPASAAK